MFYMSEFLHKPSFQWHPYGLGVVNGVREGVAVRAGVIGLCRGVAGVPGVPPGVPGGFRGVGVARGELVQLLGFELLD